ncbi:MAG: hypothetical protein JNM24_04005 [Bdellovibrionaceae bacterium]|nr:hypothetical protein [Pseudobdellovibrionaceae bacterium]
MSILNRWGMCAGLYCLFHLSTGLSQVAPEAQTAPPAEEVKLFPAIQDEFDSMLSFGYRPKKGNSTLSLRYFNMTQTSILRVFSGTTLNITKLADVTSQSSKLELSYNYGLSEKVNIGITTVNSLSSKSEFKYTTTAKASGNVDYTTNRSGAEEPILSVDYVFIKEHDLLVVGELKYSPKTGDATSSNSLRGGSSSAVGLNVFKAVGVFEYSGGMEIESLSEASSKSDTSTTESTGGSKFIVGLGVNMYITPNASLFAQGTYVQVATSTDKISTQTNKVETDAYGTGTILVGYQYALSKNLLFQAAVSGLSADSISAKQGTSKVIQDETSARGVGVGLKFGF